jgi:hypothetical protein
MDNKERNRRIFSISSVILASFIYLGVIPNNIWLKLLVFALFVLSFFDIEISIHFFNDDEEQDE